MFLCLKVSIPGLLARFSATGKKFIICSLYSGIFLGYTMHTEQMFEVSDGDREMRKPVP